MQQFIFTIEYVKLNLPFRQFLTLITMEEIIYRNYFTHSFFVLCKPHKSRLFVLLKNINEGIAKFYAVDRRF